MALNAYLNKRVSVLTLDGRTMVGLLHSCDGSMNLVLQEAVERIIRPYAKEPVAGEEEEEDIPSEEVPLGLYIIRGDSVAVVGRVDEELDGKINWGKVRGEVLGGTRHS
ncbi:Sm-like ribonucleo protein [Clathrospora elynae]|uniref:LSM2-LSM8 complex subunit LSM8 n=1 Tax=Clathrospora elynae TaxID=706981 RepID=A0A6A5SD35_9PLEO|nr:Sm-like ribonucleo protein [Clathrospora elynae]